MRIEHETNHLGELSQSKRKIIGATKGKGRRPRLSRPGKLTSGYYDPWISRTEPQDLMMDVTLALVSFFTIFLYFPFEIRMFVLCLAI